MSKITEQTENPTGLILPNVQFIGTYESKGGNYFQNNTNGFLIKVCERKEPTALKPRFYTLNRTDNGKFDFLTSFYPMDKTDTYKAEIRRQYFEIVYTKETLIVKSL